MSMNKEELFDIFREYASKEFKDIPKSDDEIDYEFSEEFEKKMTKLIESIDDTNQPVSKKHRKVITILIAAIIALFAGIMSVGAVREPLVELILEKYEDFVDFIFKGDTSKKIEYIYSFQPIPEGFEETDSLINENTVHIEYLNFITGDKIILNQSTTDGIQLSMDTENGEITKVLIDGNTLYIYRPQNDDVYIAKWIQDTYLLHLTFYGKISEEELIELIETIS